MEDSGHDRDVVKNMLYIMYTEIIMPSTDVITPFNSFRARTTSEESFFKARASFIISGEKQKRIKQQLYVLSPVIFLCQNNKILNNYYCILISQVMVREKILIYRAIEFAAFNWTNYIP